MIRSAGALTCLAVLLTGIAFGSVRHWHRIAPLMPVVVERPPRRLVTRPRWLPWTVGGCILAIVVTGTPLAAPLGVAIGFGVMRVWDRRRRGHDAAARDQQLADVVRAIAASLRAGLSVPQSMANAAAEASPPLDRSMHELVSDLDLGVPTGTALERWSSEMGSDDARLLTGVLDLHRRSGGDLPAVLDQVAETLRERRDAAAEVRGLTAQARLSGTILGVLPLGFFAFLWLTSRTEIQAAIATPIGLTAIAVGLTLEVLAFVWIKSLLDVRW